MDNDKILEFISKYEVFSHKDFDYSNGFANVWLSVNIDGSHYKTEIFNMAEYWRNDFIASHDVNVTAAVVFSRQIVELMEMVENGY